jgi:hypothetical protein
MVPVYAEPARYNLWLTQSEWQSLIPDNPIKGQTIVVSDSVRWRIVRYHLVDGTAITSLSQLHKSQYN